MLVVPWIILTGYLGTASHVPMIHTLFESKWDATVFILDRPVPLAMTLTVMILLVIAWLKPAWLPGAISAPLRNHGAVYALLLFWLVAAYVAFHLIVPAASFFFERLSLVLWTPFVLMLNGGRNDHRATKNGFHGWNKNLRDAQRTPFNHLLHRTPRPERRTRSAPCCTTSPVFTSNATGAWISDARERDPAVVPEPGLVRQPARATTATNTAI